MPIALYLTLISLGLFLLTTIFYGALAAFSESRFFFILISFSVSCVLFSVIESVHILLPDNNFGLIGVQIFYMLIVLLNPVLLLGILNQNGSIRSFLIGLLITNGILFVTIISAAFIDSSLLNIDISAGRLTIGPFRYLRVVAAILNWLIALALIVSRVRRRTENTVHYYLIVGYVLLVAGSLLDVFLLSRAIPKGRMSQGFYPGLILGLMAFHTFVTLYLSRSYRDREKESRLNVHAMEESKKELMRMAYYDDMTGRPNRKSFLLHLNHHIIETLSLGKTKAVFLLDLDNFRDINDTFGYSYGDLVIKNVGEKIEDRFGVRDRLYRLYGNQFAIIWDEIRDRGHALDTATAILDDLTSLVEIDASNLYMGVSLGVVMLPEDGDDVNEVFRRCETALAEAKKDKNTFFFYSSELESRTQKKMSIVNSLREALSKEQFEVVYQPIVESDGRLAEMEALIRCNHPNLKETSPEVFISVAESSGLIIPLTWWLMDHVAKEAVKFAAKAREVRININMSPKILKSRDLVDRIAALGRKRAFDGSHIGFEITEGALIENVEQVLRNLKGLRERGFHIALDDFGTGYSSLSYIKNLPLDKIKIDKKFTFGISRDNRDEALINSIISIADNLKMDIVAEGVEMPNQLAYLQDRGCRFFQGFLFSKPIPIQELMKKYS